MRGDRADRDGLLGAFERGRVDIRTERLRDALPDQKQRIRNANRQENVERAARDIDPEAADGANRMPRKAANERDRQHDAGRGRQIVLMRQPEHLHEIGERAFATVILPIGIGDEAHRRIERQILGNCGLLGRIERQESLQPHQRVNDEETAEVKQQHADRIGHRVLFLALVHAGDLVDREFDGPQDRREEMCARH